MAIFNEAYLAEASGSSLSNKQLEAIIKAVSKTYAPAIKSAIKCLQSFKNLKEAAFGIRGGYGFDYDQYNDEISCYVEGFDNYPYFKEVNGKEAVKLLNEFKTDLKKYLAEVNKQIPNSHFVIMDDEGYDINNENIQNIIFEQLNCNPSDLTPFDLNKLKIYQELLYE